MINLALLTVACGILAWHNFRIGGGELVRDGLVGGGRFLLGIMPIIIIFSLISGQIAIYYKKRPEHIREMIAGRSVIKAAIAGTCMPGGSTSGPVLQEEWRNGGNKYSIVGCFLAISLLNWTTLLFRLPFFGERLTIVIFGIGLVITLTGVGILSLLQCLVRT